MFLPDASKLIKYIQLKRFKLPEKIQESEFKKCDNIHLISLKNG